MSATETIAEFRKGLRVEPCVKTKVPQLIGLFGQSGGGKTVTALKWAIAMVGADKRIGGIDTENRRMGLAADFVARDAAKHYGRTPEIVVINMDGPFHPLKYVAALQELEEQGCAAAVVDSASHSWMAYLDLKEEALDRMAGNDWKRRESCAMAAAAQTKPHTHAKFIHAVLHSKMAMFLCFRAKEKTRIEKDAGGKTKIVQDDFSTPIQEAGLIYEMLISAQVEDKNGDGGYCSFKGPGRKFTHPEILALLPREDEQFDYKHGEALAAWCNGAPKAEPIKKPADKPTEKVPTEATRVWMFEKLKGLDPQRILAYAIDAAILMPNETLDDWPLHKVPTSKEAMDALRIKIVAHV